MKIDEKRILLKSYLPINARILQKPRVYDKIKAEYFLEELCRHSPLYMIF